MAKMSNSVGGRLTLHLERGEVERLDRANNREAKYSIRHEGDYVVLSPGGTNSINRTKAPVYPVSSNAATEAPGLPKFRTVDVDLEFKTDEEDGTVVGQVLVPTDLPEPHARASHGPRTKTPPPVDLGKVREALDTLNSLKASLGEDAQFLIKESGDVGISFEI